MGKCKFLVVGFYCRTVDVKQSQTGVQVVPIETTTSHITDPN